MIVVFLFNTKKDSSFQYVPRVGTGAYWDSGGSFFISEFYFLLTFYNK